MHACLKQREGERETIYVVGSITVKIIYIAYFAYALHFVLKVCTGVSGLFIW